MVDQTGNRASDLAHTIVRLFGVFTVEMSGRDVAMPGTRKARALLAYLISSAGDRISREKLASLLWSDRRDEQAKASLRQAIYSLGNHASGAAPLLSIERAYLGIDATRFRSDLDDMRLAASDPARMAILIGDEFPDFLAGYDGISAEFDEWLRLERARRHDERRLLVLAAGHQDLISGSADAATRLSAALLFADRTDESAAQLAMAACHRRGDREGARRIYARLEEALREELGVSPASETAQARDGIGAGSTVNATVARPSLAGKYQGERAHPFVSHQAPVPTHGRSAAAVGSALLGVILLIGAIVTLTSHRTTTPSLILALEPFTAASSNVSSGTIAAMRDEIANELRSSPLSRADIRVVRDRTPNGYQLAASISRSGKSTRFVGTLAEDGDILGTIPLQLGAGSDLVLSRRAAHQVGDTLNCYFEALSLAGGALPREARTLWLRMCLKDIDNQVAIETSRRLTHVLPAFSDAWSARALAAGYRYDIYTDRAYVGEARSAADRALAIDPHNGDALVAKEMLLPKKDFEGRENLDRAAAAARSSLCHCSRVYLAGVLFETGRIDDALIQAKAASDEMPLDPARGAWLADLYRLSGNLAESNTLAAQLHELWPDEHFDRFLLVNAITERNVRALRLIVASEAQSGRMRAAERDAFAALAKSFETNAAADLSNAGDLLTALSLDKTTNGIRVIEALAVLGRDEAAAQALRKYGTEYPYLLGELFSPTLKKVRQLPAAVQLGRESGLATFWKETGKWPDICRRESYCDHFR